MRAILEIRSGPREGEKTILDPGGSLRVGRTDRADLVIEADRKMAAVHFEIRWDGARCSLADRSGSGALLGGRTVTEAEVPHGGWIRAGGTDFSVHVEGRTPPRRDRRSPPLSPEIEARREQVWRALAAEPGPLHAVLDVARSLRIQELLRESVDEARSLYEGPRGVVLADVAPRLVRFSKGSRLLERLVREGFGERWGVYLTCGRPFKEVRAHLRRFLIVTEEETSERLYFRYYDPAVLRVFLPTCGPRQREQLFGEIGSFLMEGERGDLVRFSRSAAPEDPCRTWS